MNPEAMPPPPHRSYGILEEIGRCGVCEGGLVFGIRPESHGRPVYSCATGVTAEEASPCHQVFVAADKVEMAALALVRDEIDRTDVGTMAEQVRVASKEADLELDEERSSLEAAADLKRLIHSRPDGPHREDIQRLLDAFIQDLVIWPPPGEGCAPVVRIHVGSLSSSTAEEAEEAEEAE